uniref:Peptide-O-fucosyltransferase n=1 Tax=Ciona savignyi TaxID=51511 RepID=H2YSY8_CIOSA
MTMDLYRKYEKQTGITFTAEDSLLKSVKAYPREELMTDRPLTFGPSIDELLEYYGSEKKFALFAQPFANLKVSLSRPKGDEPKSLALNSMTDVRLYSEVIRFTSLPPHMKDIASQFVHDVMGNRSYVTIHWRFDKLDFMASCLDNRATIKRQRFCSYLRSIKPVQIAYAIVYGLKEINRKRRGDVTTDDVIKDVYIATPPSQFKLMKKLDGILRRYNITLNYGVHLRRYVLKTFNHCDWLLPNLNEVLSNTEMALCMQSHTFYRAVPSSWSSNVVLSKNKSKFDRPILNLIGLQKAKPGTVH